MQQTYKPISSREPMHHLDISHTILLCDFPPICCTHVVMKTTANRKMFNTTLLCNQKQTCQTHVVLTTIPNRKIFHMLLCPITYMQPGLGLTTNELLGHLSFYLNVRPFTNMPHQCRLKDNCALMKFVNLYHCATSHQHARLVFLTTGAPS